MPTPPRTKVSAKAIATDLRGAAQLATQGTLGLARMAEGVHQSVLGTLGARGDTSSTQTGSHPQATGLTGWVYSAVRGITTLVGKSADTALRALTPLLETAGAQPPESPQRAAVVAALNGVLGDHLAATGNPLATPMSLRFNGVVLEPGHMPAPTAVNCKLLIVLHGLCMNDLQWEHAGADGTPTSHAAALAQAHGYTPVFVRYNTGLHTSVNGAALSEKLSELVAHWPVAVESITVLVHSMGGLVARSACAQAQTAATVVAWRPLLKALVFLGTPHHGAPLERAGNWVDVVLGSTPYSRPLAKLGQLRSAGITDLRYGLVQASDWQGHDRFRRQPGRRTHLPLPEGVACYTVAATVAKPRSLLAERLVGDGLVPLQSALGRHDDAARTLRFAKNQQAVVYRLHHMELLSSPVVRDLLVNWLA
ncbi:alpha/beta hydrolase [Rhodoferax sp. TBRC 17660]|uniref:Alpha/beta hydrolase n=1 Tax=Rhodoferax potami TaxID=3068338 RepID=A0ABU3KNE2_9BURK|nr:alpha/beta hydrolase [Rhodoferax sp. TBRC 17660]MDT7519324.1 alpha/beta hydrolase [Rhodoferax sp. TBRC 17660]